MKADYNTGDTKRHRMVGVMGSGREEHSSLAEPLGEWIASQGYDLLTGGGPGVMAAAARGFHRSEERRGIVLGVLPGLVAASGHETPRGYPNPWIDVVVRTHLPLRGERGAEDLSRNHINVLSADAVVALPGGAGTRSEVELALRYGRPLIAFLGDAGTIEGLDPSRVPVARTLAEVTAFLRDALPPRSAR